MGHLQSDEYGRFVLGMHPPSISLSEHGMFLSDQHERHVLWQLSFNQPIGSWDTSSVTTMEALFYGASASISRLVVGTFPVGNLELYSTEHRLSISLWGVGYFQGPNMFGVFAMASAFNQPIQDWDISSATNTMPCLAELLLLIRTSATDLRSVQDLGRMFDDAHGLSDLNRRLIHANFSKNATWSHNWSTSLEFV